MSAWWSRTRTRRDRTRDNVREYDVYVTLPYVIWLYRFIISTLTYRTVISKVRTVHAALRVYQYRAVLYQRSIVRFYGYTDTVLDCMQSESL